MYLPQVHVILIWVVLDIDVRIADSAIWTSQAANPRAEGHAHLLQAVQDAEARVSMMRLLILLGLITMLGHAAVFIRMLGNT